MILLLNAMPRHAPRNRRIVENGRKVQPARLPVLHSWLRLQHVDTSHHLIDGPESHLRHIAAQLLRDEEKEINHMLGLSLELPAQQRILRGNAHRTGIEVALAHHDAAHGNQRRRRKSKFLSTQERRNRYVSPGLQLAIGLYSDAAAQIIQQ